MTYTHVLKVLIGLGLFIVCAGPVLAITGVITKVKGVTVSAVTDTTATVTWDKSHKAKHYQVKFMNGDGSVISKTMTKRHHLTFTGLTASTEYLVKVRAKRAGEFGPFSKTVTVTTDAASDNSNNQTTPQTYDVSIVNYAFSPSDLTVKVGDTVRWTNNGSVSHTASASDGTTFNSGTLTPGETYEHTFTSAGTFNYFCAMHPTLMTGTITVEN